MGTRTPPRALLAVAYLRAVRYALKLGIVSPRRAKRLTAGFPHIPPD
jgi:hypothetical protein